MKPAKFSLQAFLMACLIPGWGLVYVGRTQWGIRVAALLLGGVALMGALGLVTTPLGLYAFFAFVITVKLTSAIVSAVLARRYSGPPNVPRKRFHALYVGVVVILVLTLDVFRVPLLGFKNYYIPSGSMVPTLSIGDYIMSDLRAGVPKVGDIVVYRWNGTEAVKRWRESVVTLWPSSMARLSATVRTWVCFTHRLSASKRTTPLSWRHSR